MFESSLRIPMNSLTTLNLYSDQLTTSRRTSPVQQLTCVGKFCQAFQPHAVLCVPVGSDGAGGLGWRCEADLLSQYKFCRVEVQCEGWISSTDPYILKGSCGLKYTPELVPIKPKTPQRVTMSSLTSFTLHSKRLTTSRRVSPVQQLTCIGENCTSFQPKLVTCIPVGSDGAGGLGWKCKADLPVKYKFGSVEVQCEGWASSTDPYIRAGSCGLKYSLLPSVPPTVYPAMSNSNYNYLWLSLIILVIGYVVFSVVDVTITPAEERRIKNQEFWAGILVAGLDDAVRSKERERKETEAKEETLRMEEQEVKMRVGFGGTKNR